MPGSRRASDDLDVFGEHDTGRGDLVHDERAVPVDDRDVLADLDRASAVPLGVADTGAGAEVGHVGLGISPASIFSWRSVSRMSPYGQELPHPSCGMGA